MLKEDRKKKTEKWRIEKKRKNKIVDFSPNRLITTLHVNGLNSIQRQIVRV